MGQRLYVVVVNGLVDIARSVTPLTRIIETNATPASWSQAEADVGDFDRPSASENRTNSETSTPRPLNRYSGLLYSVDDCIKAAEVAKDDGI